MRPAVRTRLSAKQVQELIVARLLHLLVAKSALAVRKPTPLPPPLAGVVHRPVHRHKQAVLQPQLQLPLKQLLNPTAQKKDAASLNQTADNSGTDQNLAATSSNSSSSNSFVDPTGAGSSSSATIIAPDGTITSSSDTIYTPGATGSSGSASANSSGTLPPTVDTTVTTDPVDATGSSPTAPPPPASALRLVQGTRGRDRLQGSQQHDLIQCQAGDDRVRAGAGDDQVFGLSGNDWLLGETGNDWLEGNNGKDRLYGGAGDDALNGGAKDDILVGGFGQDRLTGGLGADTFGLTAETSTPGLADIVIDFKADQGDKLQLKGNLSFRSLVLITFDSNQDGIADATLIRTRSNGTVCALVLDTVNAAGKTTLAATDFI